VASSANRLNLSGVLKVSVRRLTCVTPRSRMTAVSTSLRTGPRSSWGALNVFANVATILTDAFWFSAVR
jgi:hypothetical protein